MTTRRDVLRGAMIAAAPTALATPAIAAAGDTSPLRAADNVPSSPCRARRGGRTARNIAGRLCCSLNKLVTLISVPEWWCGYAF
jgi:hypothetical protein